MWWEYDHSGTDGWRSTVGGWPSGDRAGWAIRGQERCRPRVRHRRAGHACGRAGAGPEPGKEACHRGLPL